VEVTLQPKNVVGVQTKIYFFVEICSVALYL
jgi:hypothetical protein